MKILVTGGAGFIGSHLVKRLLDRGDSVLVIDNFNNYYDPKIKRSNIKGYISNKKFKLFEIDIRDDLRHIFEENNIDQVVHLAARAGVRPSIEEPLLYSDVNIIGTANILENCREFDIKTVIFGSSSSVYGINSKVPFTEVDILEHPISPYAVTKISGEQLCKIYSECYSINITCLRFFTVFGPRQRPEMAIHKFVNLISQDKQIPFYGDGTTGRDYTYVTDIIDGILSAMDKKFSFEIINLGDSNVVKLKELVEIMEKEIGKKAVLKTMANQPGDVPITYADISKAKKLLGYSPKIKIHDGIANFVKWYNKQQYLGGM